MPSVFGKSVLAGKSIRTLCCGIAKESKLVCLLSIFLLAAKARTGMPQVVMVLALNAVSQGLDDGVPADSLLNVVAKNG